METMKLFSPLAPKAKLTYPSAKRLDTLEGKTIALYWNRKSGGDRALKRVEENLLAKYKEIKLVKFDDDFPCKPTTPKLIAQSCDGIIGSTGD